MAAAKKCDRCGKYYDKELPDPYLRVCSSMKIGNSARYIFDLCEYCTDVLTSFMNGWPDIHHEENMQDCVEKEVKENESN